ncbi:MAG: 2-phosphosulfolactate phosphatase [Patescibacteria group bacterium]|nr:2-phosphosulfolactate phosphatase [Patescibacteria group bacterium]
MPPLLHVYALPHLVQPEELAGSTVVVIDVLRATTTICHAVAAGVEQVVPCLEVEDALAVAKSLSGKVVLGGERGGLRINGFDLGNSPREYTSDRLDGATLVFTTTNGTRAMHHAHQAPRVILAAFVNASAVVQALVDEPQVYILCAGTCDQYSEDDVLLAGLLVERLERIGGFSYAQNAQAATAREYWFHSFAQPKAMGVEPLEPELLVPKLRMSAGGRNLVAVGLEDDLLDAAQIDRFDCVPEYYPATGRIRPT